MRMAGMMGLAVWVVLYATAAADPDRVTHRQFQAVNENGTCTFSGPTHVILEGILLNNPEDWLDPTAHYNPSGDPNFPPVMGGEWEIFIQGENDPNGYPDEAGTACWMGQNYGSLSWVNPARSYTDREWLKEELYRLNRDPNTQWVFRAGDRIRVTGKYMPYKGKCNINEQHSNDPDNNFTLELLKPAVGLPQPIEITLADLRTQTNVDIFDPNRLEGGEFYQSRRVRLQNVYIINPENWGPGSTVTVSDGQGRTFPVRLGRGNGIRRYACPLDWIDIIGIMNQDGMTNGYYLMALNYDGSGRVLGDASNLRGNLPGDVNNDYKVDLLDFVELAENWLTERAGLYPPPIEE